MEQVTVIYDTYKFEELSEKSQEKVIQKYREDKTQWSNEYVFECILDDWKEKLEDLGFLAPKLYFSGFSCQGDGACFEAECDLHELIKHVNTDNIYRHLVPFINENQITVTIESNSFATHYSHERTRHIEIDQPFWKERCPRAAALSLRLRDELEEFRYDLAHELYVALEKEWDYHMSDECIKEDIQCNELTFLENGEIFNS